MDPETRHGHKTAARGFDGYKGHIGVDPDSEIITATVVGAGNVGDAAADEGPRAPAPLTAPATRVVHGHDDRPRAWGYGPALSLR